MHLAAPKPTASSDWQLIPILIGLITISGLSFGILAMFGPSNERSDQKSFQEDFNNSETADIALDLTNIVQPRRIQLSKYNSAITITNAGSYTLTGTANFPIIIDASSAEVELILDNVEITSPETTAIIGLAADSITIKTTTNSKNKLTDGGNSRYDGCIFSNVDLTFDGTGELEIIGQQLEGEGIATETADLTFENGTYRVISNDDGLNAGGDGGTITINNGTFYINAGGDGIDSNQNAVINGGTIFVIGSDTGGDAGIDTDTGFTINGGTVIALGSDMLEAPKTTSHQNSLALTLDQAIAKDTLVSLQKSGESLLTFSAPKKFKTLLISSNLLANGTYEIYTGGSHTGKLIDGLYIDGKYSGGKKLSVHGTTIFEITTTINQYGQSTKERHE